MTSGSGTTTQEGTGIYELAELAHEVEMTADPDTLRFLSRKRNVKLNEVMDKGASVEAIVAATGMYRSTVILVRHPERFPEYARNSLGRGV
jgi:hypothetical protein